MFDKLKKAFGFGEPDEADELIVDDPDTGLNTPTALSEGLNSQTDERSPETESVVLEIFNHVVEQFNEALPDFLKKSVNPDLQKKALYDSLSNDVKRHLSELEQNVSRQLEDSWRQERDKLRNELKTVSKTAKDIEAKRAELKSQQLSADRQKRAMTERIHELEKRYLSLEAEKEQLDLENKSMINKVKVAAVHEKDNEQLREQIASLQQALNESKMQTGKDSSDQFPWAKLEALESKLAEAEKTKEQLTAANTELTGKNLELVKIEKNYKTMIGKMGLIEKQLSEIDKLNESKDAKIKSLTEQLGEAQKRAEKAEKQLKGLSADAGGKASTDEGLSIAAEKDAPYSKTERIDLNDDDILNDTDWIVQTTPKKGHKRKEGSKGKKNMQHDDDRQMSLW